MSTSRTNKIFTLQLVLVVLTITATPINSAASISNYIDDDNAPIAPEIEFNPPVGSQGINVIPPEPKLKDFQQSIKSAGNPESKVTISVGEKNGFQYTVLGYTNSEDRISVSGEYFNDEATHYGYARLFMVVDTGIAYYALRPRGNTLDIYVENYRYNVFNFQIITPRPVSAFDLNEGQINATALLVTGPSRSAILN